LAQLASSIGNRRFASILQGFLHKYIQQITLPKINISKRTNEDENAPPKARVNLWHNDRWGSEELPLADWPMPENNTNFESIKLRFAYTSLGISVIYVSKKTFLGLLKYSSIKNSLDSLSVKEAWSSLSVRIKNSIGNKNHYLT
jgi:hypothetical protein